jgi:hypothetical protein
MDMYRLSKESLHPPAVVAGDEEEIPWVLIENEAYADRRNSTTAFSESEMKIGKWSAAWNPSRWTLKTASIFISFRSLTTLMTGLSHP